MVKQNYYMCIFTRSPRHKLTLCPKEYLLIQNVTKVARTLYCFAHAAYMIRSDQQRRGTNDTD